MEVTISCYIITEVTSTTLAVFYWLEASHRSRPHSTGGDHTECDPKEAVIIGGSSQSLSAITPYEHQLVKPLPRHYGTAVIIVPILQIGRGSSRCDHVAGVDDDTVAQSTMTSGDRAATVAPVLCQCA